MRTFTMTYTQIAKYKPSWTYALVRTENTQHSPPKLNKQENTQPHSYQSLITFWLPVDFTKLISTILFILIVSYSINIRLR